MSDQFVLYKCFYSILVFQINDVLLIVKVVFVSCILLALGLCVLQYLEGGCLTGQPKFTCVFEHIANVFLISVYRTQFHTIMISLCCAQRVCGEQLLFQYGYSKLSTD